MKLLLDFFPIILFFIAYKLGDIYIATTAAILASLAQVVWSRWQTGQFQKMPLATFASLFLLGGATLLFRNDMFIKWKPTVLYWVLSLVFLGSHFIGDKPVFQRAIEKNINLPDKIWRQLNLCWSVFFLGMGITNLYVVYHFDTSTWVNFKLFGTMGLTFIFIILQGFYIAKHHSEPTQEKPNG